MFWTVMVIPKIKQIKTSSLMSQIKKILNAKKNNNLYDYHYFNKLSKKENIVNRN